MTGLTNTDRNLIEVARSFGATDSQIYTKVRLPAAIPFIIAGLRLSVARALVGVVVAELFGARAGLGFLILNAAQAFDTAGLFVGVHRAGGGRRGVGRAPEMARAEARALALPTMTANDHAGEARNPSALEDRSARET